MVAGPATRGCKQTEVIDLVNDGAFKGNQASENSSKTRKRRLVVEPSDDDSLDKWKERKETFDSETCITSLVAQKHEDGLFNATASESLLVWDGGSLSFLDDFKDNEMPKDFSDDDVSTIGDQTDIVIVPEGFERDSLNESEPPVDFSDCKDDAFFFVLQETHTPGLVDNLNRKASPFLDHPTRMISADDVQPDDEAFVSQEDEFVFNISLLPLMFDKGLVVPWDYIIDSPSDIVQNASSATTIDKIANF